MEKNYSNISSRQRRNLLDQSNFENDCNLTGNKSYIIKNSDVINQMSETPTNLFNKNRGQIKDYSEVLSGKGEKEKQNRKRRRSSNDDDFKEEKNKKLNLKRNGSTLRKKLSSKSIDKNNKLNFHLLKKRLSNISETIDTAPTDIDRVYQKKFNNVEEFMQNLTKKFKNVVKENESDENEDSISNGLKRSIPSKIGDRSESELSKKGRKNKVNIRKDIDNNKKNEIINHSISQFSFKKYPKNDIESIKETYFKNDLINNEKYHNIEETDFNQDSPYLGNYKNEYNEKTTDYNKEKEASNENYSYHEDEENNNLAKPSNPVNNNSLFKSLKFKLHNKIAKNKFQEKISIVTEKLFETIIPEVSDTTPLKAYEIKLDFKNINEIFDTEVKPRTINFNNYDESAAPKSGNKDEILETIKEEFFDDEIFDNFKETEENFSIQNIEYELASRDRYKFTLVMNRQFSLAQIDIYLYLKSTIVIFILVFVFYKYISKTKLLDQRKVLVKLGVPTLLFGLIIVTFILYINTKSYKVKLLCDRLKAYIKNESKVISKDELTEFMCKELRMERLDLIKSKYFIQVQDSLTLDNGIEEFINFENNDILSWRKRLYHF